MWRTRDHRHVKAMLDGESLDTRRGNRLARWTRSFKISRTCLVLTTLFVLLLFFLVSLSSRPSSPRAVMRPVVDDTDARVHSIPITSTLPGDRILILQHVYPSKVSFWQGVFGKDEEPLYHASVQSHEKYAETWGYGFKVDRGSWLSGDSKRSKHLSKVYSLLHAVLEELEKGESGAEWILFADADTLILNPAMALSEFLPPASVHPPPLILANTDHRGFNAGVMVFRVSLQLATFLMSLISNEAVLFAANGVHPSDQHLFGYTLQQSKHANVRDRFYSIPQRWLNAYWVEGHGPALHVHLVNQRKWQEDWRHTVVGHADGVYKKGAEMVQDLGGAGHPEGVRAGLEMMDEWREVREAGRRFWQDAKGGIEGILFNEI